MSSLAVSPVSQCGVRGTHIDVERFQISEYKGNNSSSGISDKPPWLDLWQKNTIILPQFNRYVQMEFSFLISEAWKMSYGWLSLKIA